MYDVQAVIDESMTLRELVRQRPAGELVNAAKSLVESLRTAGGDCSAAETRERLEAEVRYWGIWIYEQTEEFVLTTLKKLPTDPKPPYKFLSSFEEADAEIFFGRTDDIRSGVTTILQNRVTVVYGPVGSGKTSLLRAGIAPALRKEGLAVIWIRSGGDPQSAVGRALSRLLAPDAPGMLLDESELVTRLQTHKRQVVLLIDQLEEAFVFGGIKSQDSFFSFLRRMIEDTQNGAGLKGLHRVVLGIRNDFVDRLLRQNSVLPGLLQHTIPLSRLTTDQARSAIAGPAHLVGLVYEQGVLDEVVGNLSRSGLVEPSELQIVCDSLYRNRPEGAAVLDQATYSKTGGVDAILSSYLDRVLDALGERRDLAKTILGAMVSPELTSVPVPLEQAKIMGEQQLLSEDETSTLLTSLEQSRLIRRTNQDATEFELAHEFLISRIRADFDDREVRVLDLRANLRQGQSTWAEGYPIELLEQATELYNDVGLSSEDSARFLAAAIIHNIHIPHWIRVNLSNEKLAEEVGPLVQHGDTEISRRAIVALSFAGPGGLKGRLIERLRQVGNPNVRPAMRELEVALGAALGEEFLSDVDEAVSFRLKSNLAEVPAASYVIGATDAQVEAILSQGHLPFSAAFFEGQHPTQPASCGGFLIDKYLVTNEDYKEFRPGHSFPPASRLHPVTDVSWSDAQRYAHWLGKRLPTRAEWERAGRGPEAFVFPWGNDWDWKKCNTRISGFGGTTEVTAFPEGASPFGCYDMAGNVWEWTADRAAPRSWEPPHEVGSSPSSRRVLKGGSWTQMGILPWLWHQFDYPENEGYQNVGFRCIADVEAQRVETGR